MLTIDPGKVPHGTDRFDDSCCRIAVQQSYQDFLPVFKSFTQTCWIHSGVDAGMLGEI